MDTERSRIDRVLRHNRLRQKDVAGAMGVSRTTVWLWVHGRSEPTGTNLIRLVEYLRSFEPGISAEDLLGPAPTETRRRAVRS